MMSSVRRLVVNADDFGLSDGVNEGVIEAHCRGIVTSASLMVRMPAAASAATEACRHPRLSVGLHIDVGEWAFQSGEWKALYERSPQDDAASLEAEVRAQLNEFRKLVGSDPTHIDSHQHAHTRAPLNRIVDDLARELRVPLRHRTSAIRYCGSFYGQDHEGSPLHDRILPSALAGVIATLPEGIVELCCHPATTVDFPGSYATERLVELESLCSPVVHAAIARERVDLVSFRDVDGGKG